nr:hypothetical protein GCM10020063_008990 [Dactylosporangium thailandense]
MRGTCGDGLWLGRSGRGDPGDRGVRSDRGGMPRCSGRPAADGAAPRMRAEGGPVRLRAEHGARVAWGRLVVRAGYGRSVVRGWAWGPVGVVAADRPEAGGRVRCPCRGERAPGWCGDAVGFLEKKPSP